MPFKHTAFSSIDDNFDIEQGLSVNLLAPEKTIKPHKNQISLAKLRVVFAEIKT